MPAGAQPRVARDLLRLFVFITDFGPILSHGLSFFPFVCRKVTERFIIVGRVA